jgi:hypothetical protein
MPNYIRGGGNPIFQQPFNALGVEYYGFVLPADPAAIQRNYCDKFFNQPSGGAVDFAPFGPWMILVFNNLASLASTTPPDANKGWFSERESATWVLLQERKSNRLYWSTPYIFVDNAYALCMGRETYGFPKSFAQFDISYFPEFSTYFAITTLLLEKYAPDSKGIWARLWTVTKSTASVNPVTNAITDIEAFLKALIAGFKDLVLNPEEDLRKLLEFASLLIHEEVPMVFLKEFPSATDPIQACYQAIVECPIKMTRFDKGSLLEGPYMADLRDFASHPVATDFGIPEGQVQSRFSFFARFDFLVGNGKILWESQGPS